MRAIRVAAAGGPEMLELADIETPAPGADEVRVRNEAIGVNFIDVYHRTGLYPLTFPTGLGSEGAGVIDAVGESIRELSVGDRVAYAGPVRGAYAEQHVLPAERVVRVPDDVSPETAAAAMLKGLTAEFLVRRCYPLTAGDAALVHAAAGGVGMILTQWAKAIGATVIGTAGSAEKAEIARGHGCDDVILYREGDVAARVREITGGEGVRVVYDGVGASTFEASLASLGRRGMLVSFGNASGPVPAVEPLRLSRAGSLFLTRPTLFDYIATRQELEDAADALFDVIRSGAVKIEIGQRFSLKRAADAHRALEARRTTGSTILIP